MTWQNGSSITFDGVDDAINGRTTDIRLWGCALSTDEIDTLFRDATCHWSYSAEDQDRRGPVPPDCAANVPRLFESLRDLVSVLAAEE